MVRILLNLVVPLGIGRFSTVTSKENPLAEAVTPKETGQPSTRRLREKRERERGRALIVLPYFQHTSIFQNTNVLPQNTAELQHPTGCIINEESGVRFTLCHPEPLFPYLFLERLRSLRQVAVPCGSLRGPRMNFPRKGVNIPRGISLYPALLP